MHRVERNAPPKKLLKKHNEWIATLKENNDISDGWEQLNASIKEDIRAALREMYKGCCCYCEGRVELVSFLQIEHFKPKSEFKEFCYDYNNLHYCCEKCNLTKGKKYSENMICPSEENPEEFIKYVGDTAVEINGSTRGKYTIEILKLNDRKELKDERAKLLRKFEEQLSDINDSIEKIAGRGCKKEDIDLVFPLIKRLLSNIEKHFVHGESYCTMYKHNLSKRVQELKKSIQLIENLA